MPGKDQVRDRSTVQSVERSLDLLEALAVAEDGLGILDLSRRVSLHPSTVHRLLATLQTRGYVRQHGTSGRYSLGSRALQLAHAFQVRADLRAEARPCLQSLMEQSGETANLVVLDDDEAVYVEQVQSPRLVRMFAAIGRHVPLHSTGCGKVLLAFMEPAERARLLVGTSLPARTRYTITTLKELERELAEIRRRGYGVDDQEQDEGVRCVAAPVRDHIGGVVAAISLSGPSTRVTKDKIPEFGNLVMTVAAQLSSALGYKLARK